MAPEVLVSLRLKTAQNALDAGNPDRALVEAEELLEGHPDHVGALRVVAAATLQMGDATVAAQAFGRVVELQPGDAASHTGIAMARFGMADLHGALDAARVATALRPDLPDGWYYTGLALERLGDSVGAQRAYRHAQALSPGNFASPLALDDAAWRSARDKALHLLPPALRRFYEDVPTTWEQFPGLDELLAVEPPLSPFTDALYAGTPPVEGNPWAERPGAIRLFKGNLGRPAASEDELAARIARALLQEALDWLGLNSDELVADASAAAAP